MPPFVDKFHVKSKGESRSRLILPVQGLGLPESERSQASLIWGFNRFWGYIYLQAICPEEEEVSWGLLYVHWAAMEQKGVSCPKCLQWTMGAEGTAELVWFSVLGSRVI